MATKQQIEVGVIAAGLAVLAVLAPLRFLQLQKRRAGRPAAAQGAQEIPPAVAPERPTGAAPPLGARDEAELQEQRAILEGEPWGRSPFAPAGSVPTIAPSAPLLKGVSITDSGTDAALINEQIVSEGDSLDEETVVRRIEPTEVVLEREGREFILRLPEEEEEE